MAEFLSPGVFIEEVSTSAQVVEAVGTSTMAIVGFTKQGPVEDPRIVTSANDFGRRFGGFTDATQSIVPHSVSAFFTNGGARCIVVRVVPSDAEVSDSAVVNLADESIGTGTGASPQGPVASTLTTLPVEPGSCTVSWSDVAAITGEDPTMVPVEDGAILVFTAGPTAVPVSDDLFTVHWTDGVGAKTFTIDSTGALGGADVADVVSATLNRATGAFTVTFGGGFAPLAVPGITFDYTPLDTSVESVTDDGAGAFSATVLGTGITGTIDYVTGAISLTWDAAGAGHPALGRDILASYGQTLYGMVATSEGLWGNYLKFRLQGNDNFLTYGTQAVTGAGTYSKYDVTIFQTDETTGVDVVKETYEELVLDDADDPLYLPAFINDNSDFVTLTDGGLLIPPSSFNGVAVVAEVMDTGDTATLNFTSTTGNVLAGAPILKTSMEITYTTGGAPYVLVVDVSGNVTGTGLDTTKTNTVNYLTGTWELNFLGGFEPDALDITADYVSEPATGYVDYVFANGLDGTLPLTRTVVSSPALSFNNQGMYALNRIDEIFQLIIPDFAGDKDVAGDQLDFAESRNDVFVILTTPSGMEAQDAADYKRITFSRRSKYASMYWPWVTVADPLIEGRTLTLPPLGHIAGIYARTDSTRNVGKAPGGTVDGAIRGINGLETSPGQGERDIVYPARINPLIDSPQTGLAVWGVRTISPLNDIFRYVHATRLFQFAEKSVFNSTQGFLFENINSSLYTSIKATIDGFLMNLFNTGHLAGNTPAQGFFVIVDSTNNPPEVFNAGQIVCDIGIAPNRPGEFIRFRFAVKTLDAS